VPGARGAWAPNATSHRGRCLIQMLAETQVGRYLAVSRGPMAYRGPVSFSGGWIRKPGVENPIGPRIIRGWRSGDVVHHPIGSF
jgi:hypothetical protein